MDEQQTGGAGVIVSQTSSRNEDTIVEVDISGSADPYAMQTLKSEAMARPGITRFTIDAESQTLVEKEKGLLVFWKLYV